MSISCPLFIEVLHEMRNKFCDSRLIVWQIVLSILATCNISRQHFARPRLILVQFLLVKDQKKYFRGESIIWEMQPAPGSLTKSHLSGPIRGQHLGHVISIDQCEASIDQVSPVWMVCQAGNDSAGNTDSRYSVLTPCAMKLVKPSRSLLVLCRYILR